MTDGDKSGAPGWHANVARVLAGGRGGRAEDRDSALPRGDANRGRCRARRRLRRQPDRQVTRLRRRARSRCWRSSPARTAPTRIASSAALAADGSSAPSPIRRATADEAREASGFAIGGIPPLGHVRPLTVLIDQEPAAITTWSGRQPACRTRSSPSPLISSPVRREPRWSRSLRTIRLDADLRPATDELRQQLPGAPRRVSEADERGSFGRIRPHELESGGRQRVEIPVVGSTADLRDSPARNDAAVIRQVGGSACGHHRKTWRQLARQARRTWPRTPWESELASPPRWVKCWIAGARAGLEVAHRSAFRSPRRPGAVRNQARRRAASHPGQPREGRQSGC